METLGVSCQRETDDPVGRGLINLLVSLKVVWGSRMPKTRSAFAIALHSKASLLLGDLLKEDDVDILVQKFI